ncbi:MAG: hypothetical protein ACOC4A_02140 [Spirochaetota bacterium]
MSRRYMMPMMRMMCPRRGVWLWVLLTVAAGWAAAQEHPTLTYVEGEVEVVRELRTLQPGLLFGARLEPFDFIATGPDGVVEMRFGALGGAPGAEAATAEAATAQEAAIRLRLDSDTAVMVHTHSPLVVELLHGSLSVETGAAGAVTVVLREGRVEAADAAVSVARGALGRLLVEAPEGRATVSVDEGGPRRLFAREDRAVLYSPERPAFENTPSSGDIGQWRGARLMGAVMAAAAAGEVREEIASRSELYTRAKGEFDAAYRNAVRAEPSILDWMRSADRERSLDDATAAELDAPLAALEEARREFEPLFRELATLMSVADGEALPPSVSEDSRIIVERLHTARYLLGLFHESQGRLPVSDPSAAPVPELGM